MIKTEDFSVLPYRRSNSNKRSSGESLECHTCFKITKILEFTLIPP